MFSATMAGLTHTGTSRMHMDVTAQMILGSSQCMVFSLMHGDI